jgi:ERCC4-type nuclease
LKYQYTDKELKELLDSVVILIDTRENQWKHIDDYFIRKKIPYKGQKLDFGDYSAMLPACPELGIQRDMYFTNDIVIERKASLDELAGNLTKDRIRFESELIRAYKSKLFLMVENPNGYSDIVSHKYRSQYEPKSFIGTLFTFQSRYNINTHFTSKELAGFFIAQTLLYHVRERLKGG